MILQGDAARSIVLIGIMGTGKSVVGKALARKTGLPAFDTDEIISSQFGLPVNGNLFDPLGERNFVIGNGNIALNFLEAPAIIVTGGGIVVAPERTSNCCASLEKWSGLEADEETTFPQRISRLRDRPLLQTANPRATTGGIAG